MLQDTITLRNQSPFYGRKVCILLLLLSACKSRASTTHFDSSHYNYVHIGTGYCEDTWVYLSQGPYPATLQPGDDLYDDDRVRECMNRCLDAYFRGVPGSDGAETTEISNKAFYLGGDNCACSSGSSGDCELNTDVRFTSYAIVSAHGPSTAPTRWVCVPYSEEACRRAALRAGLQIGGCGFGFASKNYVIKGCYAYTEAHNECGGVAFYGGDGSLSQRQSDLTHPAFRPAFHDCAGYTEYPTVFPSTPPSHSPTFVPTAEPSAHPSKMPTIFPSRAPSHPPTAVPTVHPSKMPTMLPSRAPSHLPSNFPTLNPSCEPSHHPTSNPTHVPTVQPSEIPTPNPTTSIPTISPSSMPLSNIERTGMCSDEAGEVLQSWSNCVENRATCELDCTNNDECKAITYGKETAQVCSEDSIECYMHFQNLDPLFSPMANKYGNWEIYQGSNNFTGIEYGIYTDTTFGDLVCKCVQCDDLTIARDTSEAKECDHYCAITFILGFVVLFYVGLLLASFLFMCGSDRAQQTMPLTFTRSVLGHLCGARDTICSILVPKFTSSEANRNLDGIELLMSWFSNLSLFGKLGLLWHLVDIGTDIYFAESLIETHMPLVYLSGVSLLYSCFSLCALTFLDIMLYNDGADDKFRRILRLRWGILVFVPIEDFVMIGVAAYIFYADEGEVSSFLSIVVSILSVLFFQLLNLGFEVQGVYHGQYRATIDHGRGVGGADTRDPESPQADPASPQIELTQSSGKNGKKTSSKPRPPSPSVDGTEIPVGETEQYESEIHELNTIWGTSAEDDMVG